MFRNVPEPVAIVTLSVGQTKIGAGALAPDGVEIRRLAEIATPREPSARFAAIARQIVVLIDAIGLDNVALVGVSYPEMMVPPARFSGPNGYVAADSNPVRDAISARVAAELDHPVHVEVLHDAAAAVLGETGHRGTLPGCRDCTFIVWGTGVASGIIRAGSLYWSDPVIGLMTGEIGLQVIRTRDGSFEYRPGREIPDLGSSEQRMDQWLRGPSIARRFAACVNADRRGHGLLALAQRSVTQLGLVDVNRAARRGDRFAVDLIESAGRQMGAALAPFIHYWREHRRMPFADNIVIGSGVARLGEGLEDAGEGVLISAIRESVRTERAQLGLQDYDTDGILLSEIGYEREFYAFIRSANRQRGEVE